MIPLRSSYEVTRIHPFVFTVLVVWLLAKIWTLLPGFSWPEIAFVTPAKFSMFNSLGSLWFHESIFGTLVSMLYFWVFGPAIFEIFKPTLLMFAAILGSVFSLWIFCSIHSYALAPILGAEAFLGFFLGAFMRKDIWGTVDTLVIGPLWVRIFSVPSYVLLFFWFFYLLIGNLIMDPPFSDAPMLYLIPLLGFLTGFVFASFKWTLQSRLIGDTQ